LGECQDTPNLDPVVMDGPENQPITNSTATLDGLPDTRLGFLELTTWVRSRTKIVVAKIWVSVRTLPTSIPW
jgi:hypothetical protein